MEANKLVAGIVGIAFLVALAVAMPLLAVLLIVFLNLDLERGSV